MATMTFQQFVATGRDCADLSAEPGLDFTHDDEDGNHRPMPGRLYLDGLYIERVEVPTAQGSPWCWMLVIGNNGGDYYAPTPEGIEAAERELYEFACSEGWCEPDLQGAVACGLNADWNCRAWHFGPSCEPNRNAGDVYVLDDEDDGGYSVVRSDAPDADENPVTVVLGTFQHWDAAATFARSAVAGAGQ